MPNALGLFCASLLLLGCSEEIVIAECTEAARRCVANRPQQCIKGVWKDQAACNAQTCMGDGECTGVCAPEQKQCVGNTAQTCINGQWTDAQVCPFGCSGTRCIPVSCAGLAETCGPEGKENCCTMNEIPSGNFNLINDPEKPASVSTFVLDRFEITVGRFRKFVEMYPSSKPKAGDGEHYRIPGTGWNAAFDPFMPQTAEELRYQLMSRCSLGSWTDTPGSNENKPMNCITWHEIFAFCVWDGGRMPTDAEWNFAAAGGNEQRFYPWSIPGDATVIDATYSIFECSGDNAMGCSQTDILPVGSHSPKGDGRWGHADLGGSIYEMVLDGWIPFPAQKPCIDCATVGTGWNVARGGSWYTTRYFQQTTFRHDMAAVAWEPDYGGRCARNP